MISSFGTVASTSTRSVGNHDYDYMILFIYTITVETRYWYKVTCWKRNDLSAAYCCLLSDLFIIRFFVV